MKLFIKIRLFFSEKNLLIGLVSQTATTTFY